jgi:hypothetical protein
MGEKSRGLEGTLPAEPARTQSGAERKQNATLRVHCAPQALTRSAQSGSVNPVLGLFRLQRTRRHDESQEGITIESNIQKRLR